SNKINPNSLLPGETAIQMGLTLYENITTSAYSENDRKRLAELKRLYQEILINNPPVVWDLDNKYKPTQRISPYKWSDHLRQLTKAKNKVGNFFYQSQLIAEYAATYLTERAGRFIVANGKTGDLLEQFMGEWINFAVQELSSYDFNETSIEKIKQRIKYIERIQKHEFLFKFGLYTRARNKFDTLESIRQQLYACAELAQTESLRQCARDKLKICSTNTSSLLLACVKAVYYARGSVVYHEPLDLKGYIDPEHTFLTSTAQALYPIIKSTQTGAMLYEVICTAGLESFGALAQEKKEVSYVYFDEFHASKNITMKNVKHDLAPWISQDIAPKFYEQTQKLLESVLRIAKLKQLAEIAFDLTGSLGDVWAYGDREGKLSLEALLYLLEKELDSFNSRFEKLYQEQNNARSAYTYKYRLNPDHNINKNYNKFDEQQEDIFKYLDTIKKAIKTIHDKLADFTQDEEKKINLKKRMFYKSVAHFFKQYYPQHYNKYESLDQPMLHVAESHAEEELHQQSCRFFSSNKLEDSANAKFNAWRMSFVKKHKDKYIKLQNLKANFHNLVESNVSDAAIMQESELLKAQISLLKTAAAAEAPSWSFRSLGWPFNQETHQYIAIMQVNYDAFLKDLKHFIGDNQEDNPNNNFKVSKTEEKPKEQSQDFINRIDANPFAFFKKDGSVNSSEVEMAKIKGIQKGLEGSLGKSPMLS
ncbi:MAG TPA: hypothetical protein VHA13_02090, partial [Gammaproteobacteria bacterium]|nr:hypothetical protein [Gammaproteobacteria bacterium]